ncbi:MAG: UDP-N-acetyl-D-glucosamine dehydrogenase, partial [Thaumarchaeota archaeon]|nr:UDP-N-acetyl-D-glucosamine dehydrogenase [Nitrososphaerota archaeon]
MILEKTVTKTKSKDCMIEVFGLGYVGFPLAIRLANSGFHVIGIDTDVDKIKRYENQRLLGTEITLSEKLKKSINEKTIQFKTDSLEFSNPKIGMICVPTPIASKSMDSNFYVEKAVKSFLNTSKKGDMIILESSIQAGTTEKIRGIIESHGYTVGDDFGLCFCPERIDPLNKKWKLENIPRIIYCSDDYSFEISKI